MGLSTSLNTAIGGLNAAQVGIGVVSQNVANAGTTGYVRRTVSTADSLTGLTVGVQSTQVQRLLDKIVQHQLWQEASGAAYTSTRASAMSNLDKLYGAPGSSTALDTRLTATHACTFNPAWCARASVSASGSKSGSRSISAARGSNVLR